MWMSYNSKKREDEGEKRAVVCSQHIDFLIALAVD